MSHLHSHSTDAKTQTRHSHSAATAKISRTRAQHGHSIRRSRMLMTHPTAMHLRSDVAVGPATSYSTPLTHAGRTPSQRRAVVGVGGVSSYSPALHSASDVAHTRFVVAVGDTTSYSFTSPPATAPHTVVGTHIRSDVAVGARTSCCSAGSRTRRDRGSSFSPREPSQWCGHTHRWAGSTQGSCPPRNTLQLPS